MSEASFVALEQAESALLDALKAVVEARRSLNHASRRAPLAAPRVSEGTVNPAPIATDAPIGNVKPAPLFLNDASTAALLTGRPGPRIVAVPLEPTRLVDQPRPSDDSDEGFALATETEDTAEAHDPEAQLRLPVHPLPHVAGQANGAEPAAKAPKGWRKIELDPEIWTLFASTYLQGFTVSHSRTACAPLAREKGITLPGIEWFRRRVLAEGLTRPAVQPVTPQTNTETNASVAPAPAPAEPREPLNLPRTVRSPWPAALAKPASDPSDLTDDEATEEFAAALDRVRARKSGQVKPATAQPDYGRFVAARRASPTPKHATSARPLLPADSREECRKCGVPGWKGCEHQLPYDGAEAARG